MTRRTAQDIQEARDGAAALDVQAACWAGKADALAARSRQLLIESSRLRTAAWNAGHEPPAEADRLDTASASDHLAMRQAAAEANARTIRASMLRGDASRWEAALVPVAQRQRQPLKRDSAQVRILPGIPDVTP